MRESVETGIASQARAILLEDTFAIDMCVFEKWVKRIDPMGYVVGKAVCLLRKKERRE